MEKSPDQNIVNQLLKKDDAAFSILYDQYAPAFYGFILQNELNQATAEAVLYAAFLEIKNRITEFDSLKTTLFAWMFRIVKKQLHRDTEKVYVNKFQSKTSEVVVPV